MQDRLVEWTEVQGHPGWAVCAVFDGHGINNDTVNHVTANVVPTIESILGDETKARHDPEKVLVAAFSRITIHLQNLANNPCYGRETSGCTASVLLTDGIVVAMANLGDSTTMLVDVTDVDNNKVSLASILFGQEYAHHRQTATIRTPSTERDIVLKKLFQGKVEVRRPTPGGKEVFCLVGGERYIGVAGAFGDYNNTLSMCLHRVPVITMAELKKGREYIIFQASDGLTDCLEQILPNHQWNKYLCKRNTVEEIMATIKLVARGTRIWDNTAFHVIFNVSRSVIGENNTR